MGSGRRTWRRARALATAFALLAAPVQALACACGCDVFDVGSATLIPGAAGGMVWLDYDRLDQTQNWSGDARASAADNPDKRIHTDFVRLGGQYMWGSGLGVMVELPFAARSFTTTADGSRQTFRHGGLGDMRVTGVWTGLSKSGSTGLTLGLKLPTGRFDAPGFDRDVQLGSGTVDVTLGAFHVGQIGGSGNVIWYAQGVWDHPLAARAGYSPGDEVNAAAGLGWQASSPTARFAFTPMAQLIVSTRARDSGAEADPANSGYTRLLIAPGVEVRHGKWKLYGDIELPLYQRVNGNQLVAPVLFKLIASRAF